MDPLGLNVKLIFSEPWDFPKVVFGTIIQQYTKNEEIFYLLEDNHSMDKFLVSSRYVGENVTIVMQRAVIVAIGLLDKNSLVNKSTEIFNHVEYAGYGSLEQYISK